MINTLGDKRKIQILKFIDERGTVKKQDFLEIMKNVYMINSKLSELANDGYILMQKQGTTYIISLTEKGKAMVEQIKALEQSEIGISKEEFDKMAEKWKRISALSHINVMDDHIVLREYNYDGKGNDRLVTIYVQINHDKVMRLWCDVDNSYNCWHVKYAWTLPEVQEWVQLHYQKGDIKDIEDNPGDNEVGGN
ncbi:MAG: DUF6293 family protein [Thermoplasmata archaeon]